MDYKKNNYQAHNIRSYQHPNHPQFVRQNLHAVDPNTEHLYTKLFLGHLNLKKNFSESTLCLFVYNK